MPVAVPNSKSFYRNNNRYQRTEEYDNRNIMNIKYNRDSFSRHSNIGDQSNIQEYIYTLEKRTLFYPSGENYHEYDKRTKI